MRHDLGPVSVAVMGCCAAVLTLGGSWIAQPSTDASASPRWVMRVQPAAAAVESTPASASAARRGAGGELYMGWARAMEPRMGVPARALAAYAAGEQAAAATTPQCRLSWATLAGIGAVESAHGTTGSSTVARDGVVRPAVLGPVLDGTADVAAVADTDGGRYDGHTRWERAVGPMQFIPSTWARWRTDGNRDGVADPHQFDDAAAAAARYLCASGVDTSSGEGWAQAVYSYNHSDDYVRDVYAAARWYAARSRQ